MSGGIGNFDARTEDGLPKPKEIKKLSMGDELLVFEESIVIGPTTLFFDRPVRTKDVEAIITFYTMGMAARGRLSHGLYLNFIDSIANIKILGYKEEESDG